MSIFVDIIPTVHATDKMTGLRIDDNFKLTYRIEKAGAATDTRVNFTGLLTDQTFQGTAPIGQVRIGKLGTQERVVIEVLAYHAQDEEDTVPPAGLYWYNVKSNYPFGGPAEQGKTEAVNPNFTTPQVFPIIVFNESAITPAWTTGNTVASSVPARLYGQLGSLAARRQHLKTQILANLENPYFPLWVAGYRLPPSTDAGTLLTRIQAQETLVVLLEMFTRAISIDDNLATERQFNLLNGETGLDLGDIHASVSSLLGNAIYNSSYESWSYRRLGNVGANSPWTYSPPTSGNDWLGSTDSPSLIDLTSAPSAVNDWFTWLRS